MSYNIVKDEQKMIEIDAAKLHYASSGEPIFLSFFFKFNLVVFRPNQPKVQQLREFIRVNTLGPFWSHKIIYITLFSALLLRYHWDL